MKTTEILVIVVTLALFAGLVSKQPDASPILPTPPAAPPPVQKSKSAETPTEAVLSRATGKNGAWISLQLGYHFYRKTKIKGEGSHTKTEMLLLRVWAFDADVKNGGFAQYFYNFPEDARHMVEDLKAIGALKAASLLERAISAFPGAKLPDDGPDYDAVVRRTHQKADALWDECSEAFFLESENVIKLSVVYAKQHQSDILLEW